MGGSGVLRRITDEVTGWPGVEAGWGERGEWSFRLRGREIGHLHGDRAAHFSFPAELGAALREAGRVGPHPVAPQSVKLAARRIASEADVVDVVALMRLNYERIASRPPAGRNPRAGPRSAPANGADGDGGS